MSTYKKRGDYLTFADYVVNKTGKTIPELNRDTNRYELKLIPVIANEIRAAIAAKKKIRIHADYDVDGITYAVQMAILFNYLKYPCTIKVPMRFTDGYGMKVKHTEQVDADTLLILGDNGISAIEAVAAAKRKGAKVIIMDHHLADRDEKGNFIAPAADILLDPETFHEGNDYLDYCGSGLANKLVNEMVTDKNVLSMCAAVAALGTIADVVPLTGDNRRIVRNGLDAINHGNISSGLQAIVQCLDMTGHVTAEDIAFYLAPLLNAPGRLHDQGGTWSASTLMCQDPNKAITMAETLKEINNNRKEIVIALMDSITLDPRDSIHVVCLPEGSPEGCLGLVSGRITEETGKPSFVYTKLQDGTMKGSARSDNEKDNQIYRMLAGIKDKLLGFGGHPGAGGFSFLPEHEEAIRAYLSVYPVTPHDRTPYYDLTITPDELVNTLHQMSACEPFGKGFEKPVFQVPCYFKDNEYWRAIGKDGSHVMFTLPDKDKTKAIMFHLKEQYLQQGAPKNIYLYGSPCWNWYKGNCYPQFRVTDYEPI